MEFGVYDAVSNFNIGRKASVLTFEKLNMIPGRYTVKGCYVLNKKRLNFSLYKNRLTSRNRRKAIRGRKKRKEDDDNDKEGTLYDPGGCAYK